MRKTILVNDLTTSDISDSSIYEEYKKLLEKDIEKYFLPSSLVAVPCPGCGQTNGSRSYKKLSMTFKQCGACGTHYVSPRPDARLLEKFYENSDACKFWRQESLNGPKEKLANFHGPRLRWVSELADEFLDSPGVFLDMETKYPFFLRQLSENKIFKSIIAYRPKVYEQSGLMPQGVSVISDSSVYAGKADVLSAFDLLERVFDPAELLRRAHELCRAGGLFLITTSTSSGFEYQVLGDNAPNINPVNRMNLLSLEAIKKLFDDHGFEIIELSTPGRLDVEAVYREFLKESGAIHPFWQYIFKTRNEYTRHSLQDFLQLNCLSSHVRIAARKK